MLYSLDTRVGCQGCPLQRMSICLSLSRLGFQLELRRVRGCGLKSWEEKMSRKGKRKDEDEYGSDEASHTKKAPRSESEDSDSITICDISKNRRVSVRSWQGKVVVDIREFYMKDGRVLPGKKGISLSMDQWKILRDHLDEIDEAVGEND